MSPKDVYPSPNNTELKVLHTMYLFQNGFAWNDNSEAYSTAFMDLCLINNSACPSLSHLTISEAGNFTH